MNLREAFRTVSLLRRLFLRIYSITHIPLAPVYGGFPVKLITHVGKPITFEGNITPENLQSKVILFENSFNLKSKLYIFLYYKVTRAMENLIDEHQRIPGSITRGLIERIYRTPKIKKISSVLLQCNENLIDNKEINSEIDSENVNAKIIENGNNLRQRVNQ